MSFAQPLDRALDLAALHSIAPERWPFLLQSTSKGGRLGGWSMLLHAAAGQAPLIADEGGFLHRLDAAWRAEQRAQPGRFPFEGGWFVYLGYGLAAEVEPTLELPSADDGLPVALAQRCDAAILIDHAAAGPGDPRAWLVAEDPVLLDALDAELKRSRASVAPANLPAIRLEADDGQRFMDGVTRIRDYILAGDVFQVNLSRGWTGTATADLDAVAIHRRLAATNPAPFAGLARLPGGTLLSSSPERLVSVRDGIAEVRPIAGTRPRGGSAAQDRALSDELLGHPKERAEHVMLIDLERNDLGRICVPGTVRVDELMSIESYAHVHHIVSNVVGRLRPGTGPGEVIRAVFPGGTITGCPKVRCMQIIAELETGGRSFYTGSMGYLGLDGRMDLNILIRSMLIQPQRVRFRTGAGIVADSEPAAELAETEAKARGLTRSLEP